MTVLNCPLVEYLFGGLWSVANGLVRLA
jgi:hypothetical protein